MSPEVLLETPKKPLVPAPQMLSLCVGVVVPMPTFTPKSILSLPEPKVSVPPLAVVIVELFWKTRLGLELTSPMMTLAELGAPRVTSSEPAVESMRKSGLAVVEVAMVHAKGTLLTMVEVETAP